MGLVICFRCWTDIQSVVNLFMTWSFGRWVTWLQKLADVVFIVQIENVEMKTTNIVSCGDQ